jgi:Uma2 family endonuclease
MVTVLHPPRRSRKVVATSNGADIRTLADLLHDLGDIPAERVWMTPTPGTATEKDVLEADAKFDRLCELVDGTLVEKAMGFRESREAGVLFRILDAHTEKTDEGIVNGESATMRIMPNLVRIPDVSFIAWDRLPNRELPTKPIPDLVPNLAVECLSESNTPKEMERKLRDYFKAGVEQVWFVDGEARTFEIFTSPTTSQVFSGKQTLKTGKLFPGLKLSVEAFFNRVHRKKK